MGIEIFLLLFEGLTRHLLFSTFGLQDTLQVP
jgi:hypothetical protein